jgi:hypothetical protein
LEELIVSGDDEKREERGVKAWINSLGLDHYVDRVEDEMRDGVLMLQIFDKVSPGIVQWKRVNINPSTMYKKIENCNYSVEIGKDLKFSLVGIAGKDFYDGNTKMAMGKINRNRIGECIGVYQYCSSR